MSDDGTTVACPVEGRTVRDTTSLVAADTLASDASDARDEPLDRAVSDREPASESSDVRESVSDAEAKRARLATRRRRSEE